MGNAINNIYSPAISKEITRLIDQGFVSFFVRDRMYQGKFRVKLSYNNKYHFITVIDSMDQYQDAIAYLLSELLSRSLDIKISHNLDELRRELSDKHKLSFRISKYRSKTQMITLNKLIEKSQPLSSHWHHGEAV